MAQEVIRDGLGRVVGYKSTYEGKTTYFNANGSIAAKEDGRRTYDSSGRIIGQGSQGIKEVKR